MIDDSRSTFMLWRVTRWYVVVTTFSPRTCKTAFAWRGIWIMEIILKVQGSSHTSLLFRGPSWTKPMMSSHYISQFIEDTIQQNPFTRPKLDSKQEQWAITKARLWWFEMQKLCWIDQMHEPRTSSQPTRIDRMMEFAKLQTNIKICSTSITCSNTILKPHQNCSSYKGNQILIESILQSGIQTICLQLNSS